MIPFDEGGAVASASRMMALEDRILDNIEAMKYASAELRHAYKAKDDWNLVARAIVILEKAIQGTK